MSQQAKGKGKQREPPPTLFLHPSPTASHVSLPGVIAPGAAGNPAPGLTAPAPPSQHNPSLPRQEVGANSTNTTKNQRSSNASQTHALRASAVGALEPGFTVPFPLRQESTRATDRTDALWAEMQATLEEVELSASGGTRVFGPDHDHKLAELRQAQIALAQAWARSEADEAIETNLSTTATASGMKEAAEVAGKTEGGSTTGTSARPGSAGERLGAKLEEETEVDILLARKRREANDRYFQRVSQGVLDVVAKLEDVAVAMMAVEQESKDIWGENESVPSSAKA